MQDAFAAGGFLLDGRGALARHCQGLRVNRDIVGQQRRQTQRTQPVVGAFRGQPGVIRLGFIEGGPLSGTMREFLRPKSSATVRLAKQRPLRCHRPRTRRWRESRTLAQVSGRELRGFARSGKAMNLTEYLP